jgi:hypothetical protein
MTTQSDAEKIERRIAFIDEVTWSGIVLIVDGMEYQLSVSWDRSSGDDQ